MGSPVSAVIANLVTEDEEEKVIKTAPTAPLWWYQYAEESYACIRRDKTEEFHAHLNSISPHIQFSLVTEE